MKSIVFEAPWKVLLGDTSEPDGKAGTIVRTEASVVSPGTELAILSGGESWAPLPYIPGYGSVGRVEKAGPECARRGIKEGDLVFTYGKHSVRAAAETVCVPVPAGLSPVRAAFARMAAVSITAIRCSEIELGDRVVVFGAGLVGLFAAQLARLSGAAVCVVEASAKRREIASACGADMVSAPGPELRDDLSGFTGGKFFSAAIEATGTPKVAEEAIKFVGKRGELILLGSPRGDYATNLTPFLNRSHLCPDVVTIKGAHEWRYPVLKDDSFSKHSIEGNVETILELIASGKLLVDPAVTHTVSPGKAPDIYAGLRNEKDAYLGVVFDWNNLSS